jgi:hypothetical protein
MERVKLCYVVDLIQVSPKADLPNMQEDTEKLDCDDVGNKKGVDAMNCNKNSLANLAVASTTAKQWCTFIKQEAPNGLTDLQAMW